MLSGGIEDAVVEIAPTPTWAHEPPPRNAGLDWKAVDRALRSIRRRRAALDAEEARWLREAEALQIWRPLGMVSILDYLERVLGYAPRTAQDRLRVARALGDLPRLTAALTAGELPFSAVRELTRVATPATEASWVAAATDKTLRQIEELVADRRPGDRPEDPPSPDARMHVVRFELAAETFALLRQARTVIDDEHGTNLPDDAFIAALCGGVLDGAPRGEPTGRAKFQIAVTVCERCRQGWQEGAGAQIAIDAAALDRALCDAQHIGSIDGDGPERAHQDTPPSVARFVWRRDGGRCRVDGCRSSRGLELHHLIHRADGGAHDASNIVLLCSACHLAHHRGALTISGTANELQIRRPGEAAASGMQDDAGEVAGLPAHGAHVAELPRGSMVEADASLAACGVSPVAAPDAHVGAGPQPQGSMVEVDASLAAGGALTTTDPDAHVGAMSSARPVEDTSVRASGARRLDAAILRTQAKAALTG
ncbi:MAG TPA: HNH endonuclease signature motif containing protein, partial [Gemmatimonadaceae bacterium]